MTKNNSNAPSGFDRFGLHETLNRGIKASGFDDPRPIQSETIPAGLEGQDIMGLAQTGTGKTAAFALPMLDRMVRNRGFGPRVLIVAPTRELATQIEAEIRSLARYTHLKTVTIYGGVSVFKQVRSLNRHPEFVVGCPGRILDLLQQGKLDLSNIETLVLDEADHMFDMGFLPDIRKIMKALPAQRQNMLFSATMPKEIRHLADNILQNPHVVELISSSPAATIDHGLVLVNERRKRDLLEHFLQRDECESAIVFTRTKHRARRLAQQLTKAGHKAVGIQGNLSQSKRDEAMRGFRKRRYNVLVATDIVARGIDVSGVSHVINFDVPQTPEAYTHRIGRTGRAEQEGIACTFVTGNDHKWLRATERMIGSPIQREQVAGFEGGAEVPSGRPQQRRRRPQNGQQQQAGDGSGQSRPRNRKNNARKKGPRGIGQQPDSRQHPSNRNRRRRTG